MEEYPDSSLSWFAVGCYYMATRQFEAARRYFSKATTLDRNNAHAWVGFGHAFALQVRGVGLGQGLYGSEGLGWCGWEPRPEHNGAYEMFVVGKLGLAMHLHPHPHHLFHPHPLIHATPLCPPAPLCPTLAPPPG